MASAPGLKNRGLSATGGVVGRGVVFGDGVLFGGGGFVSGGAVGGYEAGDGGQVGDSVHVRSPSSPALLSAGRRGQQNLARVTVHCDAFAPSSVGG